MHQGSCLCGAVRYIAHGDLRDVNICHCSQCRKTSGHVWAATAVPTDKLEFLRDDGLKWFASSDTGCRGFCETCGSSLFWQRQGADYVAIAPGSLDGPTGLKVMNHIFVADKGDYYDIPDSEIHPRETTS